jgi:hypothetical protein
MGAAERDPVSVTFDRAARVLLARAYKVPRGAWASTRLKDPSPAQLALWLARGVNVTRREPRVAGFRPPTRWCRAYTRALWHQHKWYSGDPDTGGWRAERRATMRWPGIEVQFGRHAQALGVIPAGYPVRVRLASAAAAKDRGRPEDEWVWADGGPRWADPARRDWAAFG